MTKQARLRGALVPALTPFKPDLTPDADRLVEHCRWLLAQGAHGLAVFGTTSEANSLSIGERIDLLEALIGAGVAPGLLMPGTGCCALSDTVRLTAHAVRNGCAGVLMLPPFYYKGVSDDGLFASLAEVIERVGDERLRVYLYHIPPVAQVGFSPALIERLLARYPASVVGLKDSSGDWPNTERLLESFPGFDVFPGSEAFLLQGLRAGGVGCITATGNVNVAAIRRVYDRWQTPEADRLQEEIAAVRKTIQAHPMIPALKAMVAAFRNAPSWRTTRPPLVALDAAKAETLLGELRQRQFAMAA